MITPPRLYDSNTSRQSRLLASTSADRVDLSEQMPWIVLLAVMVRSVTKLAKRGVWMAARVAHRMGGLAVDKRRATAPACCR
jgi:hypothetical protein